MGLKKCGVKKICGNNFGGPKFWGSNFCSGKARTPFGVCDICNLFKNILLESHQVIPIFLAFKLVYNLTLSSGLNWSHFIFILFPWDYLLTLHRGIENRKIINKKVFASVRSCKIFVRDYYCDCYGGGNKVKSYFVGFAQKQGWLVSFLLLTYFFAISCILIESKFISIANYTVFCLSYVQPPQPTLSIIWLIAFKKEKLVNTMLEKYEIYVDMLNWQW